MPVLTRRKHNRYIKPVLTASQGHGDSGGIPDMDTIIAEFKSASRRANMRQGIRKTLAVAV
eukprot:5373664-Pleurochrysis_carterae.AAC.2